MMKDAGARPGKEKFGAVLVGMAFLPILGMAATPSTVGMVGQPFQVGKADQPPLVDGALTETIWQAGPRLTVEGITVRGLLAGDALYVGAESLPKEGAEVMVTTEDGELRHRCFVGTAGTLSASEGVRGAQETNAQGRRQAEISFPLTSGYLLIRTRRTGSETVWHPLRSATAESFAGGKTREASPEALSLLSEKALLAMADAQASEGTAEESALKDIAWVEEFFALLGDERTTPKMILEQAMAQGDLPAFPPEASEEGLAQAAEQIEQWRPVVKMMKPVMGKQLDVERALVTSRSHADFLRMMEERHGARAFQGLPAPGRGGVSIQIQGKAPGRVIGALPKDLPREWGRLTEEQFQQVRRARLRPHTPAGREWMRRTERTREEP